MDRRRFTKVAGFSALSAGSALTVASVVGEPEVLTPDGGRNPRPTPTPIPPAPTPPPPAPVAMGTNLSGMEWARPGLRYGQGTKPGVNFSVPRAQDIQYLAASGFTKNRLPIQWELLQPVLHDTMVDPETQAIVGAPGELHEGYAGYITSVLDAHAASGIKCIIDCHNYARYIDFVYQPGGTVTGLTKSADPLVRPYTTDNTQVRERVFATAPGATLSVANFVDLWTRIAARWKGHPGLGGYGLMNEPHDLPAAGMTAVTFTDEDPAIWPAFAQAAVTAIRALDATTPIYVGGNMWNAAWKLPGTPGFPLAGPNVVYEAHFYLDAQSTGYAFDWDSEVAKGYSVGVGIGNTPIDAQTGVKRLQPAIQWAQAHGVELAVTETGMPIDDARWEAAFRNAVAYARSNGVEVYSWMGGNHWPARNYAMNQIPGWHQNRTLEPAVSGVLKSVAGIAGATLFDAGPAYALSGATVTITVFARGNLSANLSIRVDAGRAGKLSKTTLTIPAGANGQDSFTFTPSTTGIATITYSSAAAVPVPAPRKVYSLADPVAYESKNRTDAATALLAKYGASRWNMADGYTDFVLGTPAAEGQVVRAVADSGFGSSVGNAMEMLNWLNLSPQLGTFSGPVMRTAGGKHLAFPSWETCGLWCKKSEPMPGIQANPRNRVPYNAEDAHFAIVCMGIPGVDNHGIVFQAGKAEELWTSEITVAHGQPQANWRDASGSMVSLTAPTRLLPGKPAVLTLTSAPGAQRLRVNSVVVGSAASTFAPTPFNQMLIGWGYPSFYPDTGFAGSIYAVIAGKGAPTSAEIGLLERYIASLAGIAI